MTINIECPDCGKMGRVPQNDQRIHKVRCSQCNTIIAVPPQDTPDWESAETSELPPSIIHESDSSWTEGPHIATSSSPSIPIWAAPPRLKLWNPHLPRMVNTLCFYELVVVPSFLMCEMILGILYYFQGTTKSALPIIIIDILYYFSIAGVILVCAYGAYKLLNLEQSGLRLLRLCILVKIAVNMLVLFVLMLAESSYSTSDPEILLSGFGLITFLLLLLGLCQFVGFVFECFGLFWLFREGKRLPLIRQ